MIKLVKEFNRVFEVDTTVTDKAVMSRADFMTSEVVEYVSDSEDATTEEDKVTAQFDAVIDILYFALGTAIMHDIEVPLKKLIYGFIALNHEEYRYDFNGQDQLLADIRISIINYEMNGIEGNKEDIIKAISDIITNTLILAAANGFLHKVEEGFKEVHASNMTKVPADGVILRRESDGKILKPDTFREPELKTILY